MNAWDFFPNLVEFVKQEHRWYKACGHDFDHDLRVASYALIIAPDDRTARLAVAAAFCHSADHMLQKRLEHSPNPDEEIDIEELVRGWLDNTDLTNEERDEVVSAVLHHEDVNKDSDTLVQVTLRDADRLANMDADVIIRGGQFQPYLMAVDPVRLESDPEANYRNPKSILWDVNNCAEWINPHHPCCLRLPKARKLGEQRAAFLKLFIETIREQREEAGLIPYPPVLL